jgi:serine/threonine protein kinase
MESDTLIGKQLGVYRIQSSLGEGGMAQVYKAYDPRLLRDVAIKVVLPEIADQEGFRQRFEQEIRLSAQLEHHNIVRVYDVGNSGKLTYLVMQYVGGGTLRNQLRGGRPLEPRKATRYALQMARALHYAHSRGIIHRDVKPQNMLVSANDPNELLLSDFGIAKLFDASREETVTLPPSGGAVHSHSLTSVGQMVGTADYMAPEQINLQPVDARTDVYALGIVLYQMLTGQLPFQSSSALGLLYQQLHTVPLPVRELNPTVPELLARITAKAMAKDPQARFQSAEEMAQALETILASPSVSNYPFPGAGEDYSTVPRPSASLPADIAPPPPSSSLSPVRRSSSKLPLSYIMVGIVAVLVIVFGVWHPSIPGLSGPGPQSAGMATPFTENFQSNTRGWLATSMNGLTANPPGGGKYVLITDASVTNITYFFPHPDPSAIGTLPDKFTLTVQMMQNSGDPGVFYGLAFRFREDSSSNVYCYVFAINSNGQYHLWKFDPNAPVKPTPLYGAQLPSTAFHSGLNQSNTLQAVVQGNSFSFKVNDTVVPLNGGSQTISDPSSPFSGGQPALLVSGPNSQFTVTQMQLAIP